MRVGPVDPADGQAFSEWFAVQAACERHDRPDERGWLEHEVRATVSQQQDSRKLLWAARDGDRVVGALRADLPQHDNTHLAEVELWVHPDARRRGAARALTDVLRGVLQDDGRTTVMGYSDEVPGRPSAMTQGAGAALGAAVGQREARRDIALPLDPARVAALQELVAPHVEGYDVVVWRGHAPEPLVDDLAVLHQRMSTDVPMGELDVTEEVFDAARVRRHEELADAMDREMVGAGAVHRTSGTLVAYTDQTVPRQAPETAWQWNTIVLDDHRGHRLGTLVKLAALQELARAAPGVRRIVTWNAEENVAMIRVNDALGARVNGGSAAWQARVDR